jgi:hypothetical protein
MHRFTQAIRSYHGTFGTTTSDAWKCLKYSKTRWTSFPCDRTPTIDGKTRHQQLEDIMRNTSSNTGTALWERVKYVWPAM